MQVQLSHRKNKLRESFEAWIFMYHHLNICGRLTGPCIWKSKNDFGEVVKAETGLRTIWFH